MDESPLRTSGTLDDIMTAAAASRQDGRVTLLGQPPLEVRFVRGLVAHVGGDARRPPLRRKDDAHRHFAELLAAAMPGEHTFEVVATSRRDQIDARWLFGPAALLATARSLAAAAGAGDDEPDGAPAHEVDAAVPVLLRRSDRVVALDADAWAVVVGMSSPLAPRRLAAHLDWDVERVEDAVRSLMDQGLAAPLSGLASHDTVIDLDANDPQVDDLDEALGDDLDDEPSPVRASALRRLIRSLE
jgi:hypothetical protein